MMKINTNREIPAAHSVAKLIIKTLIIPLCFSTKFFTKIKLNPRPNNGMTTKTLNNEIECNFRATT